MRTPKKWMGRKGDKDWVALTFGLWERRRMRTNGQRGGKTTQGLKLFPLHHCILPPHLKVAQQSAQQNGTMRIGALGFLSKSCAPLTLTCPISGKDTIARPAAYSKTLRPICSFFRFCSISVCCWFCFQNLSQIHLLPCSLSQPQSQLPSSTLSSQLESHSLLLSSFSLPLAPIYSPLSSPEWPLQNTKQTMSLCLKLYAVLLEFRLTPLAHQAWFEHAPGHPTSPSVPYAQVLWPPA